MDDLFTKRVRAAAAAGWWTLMIVYCFLLIQWFLYLFVMSKQPSWMLKFWGEGFTWSVYQTLWLWGILIFKIGILLMIVVVVWLTVWGRRLLRLKE
ncbi:MAG TPA: hypothetical protein VMT12_04480 [Syntrophales bacterium]|nr:hypothetical protein [Syntrophales bacterium]